MADVLDGVKILDAKKDRDDIKSTCDYLVKTPVVEVRNAVDVRNIWTDKEGKEHEGNVLQITVLDDEHDNIFYLRDKDCSRAKLYKRGVLGVFTLKISWDESFGKRTMIYVDDFEEVKDGDET